MIKKDFKLGADPEFGFIRGKDIVPAEDVIEDKECRAEFGLDGSRMVAEIRPKPSANPFKVVSNIRNAMNEGVLSNQGVINLKWKAGSSICGDPIGGHIHFGVKSIKYNYNLDKLLDCLDRYLAHTLILLEDPEEAKDRRMDNDYGHLSDCRDQPWGFEYRTPSSWLTSPYIACSALCLAKAVVWETLYNGLESHREVEVDYDAFNAAEFKPIRKQFESVIWRDIKKFELYKKYRQPINLLHTLISKNRNWFPSCGMKAAWAIGSPFTESIRQTSLDTIWKSVNV